ncbi:hypothetical protein D0T25_21905 [Duganella sp. BJB488]|nr:hypothetical protein D0T26_31340 [Duganella sp. BJB489]RFP18207.1 hypothetical protein D0T25_21905 [Duganella sp. BJB488]RFP37969.1 hypothetical protein D0T24_08375 [Duganella sp. BJB480]
MIYQLVIRSVVNIAGQLTVFFSYSYVEKTRPCFWKAATFLRMAFTHHDLEVQRLIDHIDCSAFIFQRG